MASLHPSPEIGYGTPSAVRRSHEERKGGFSSVVDDGKYFYVEEEEEEEEEVDASPKLIQKVVAEVVGTFILMFIGCGSAFVAERGNVTLSGVAAAWSLAAVAMIYTVGHVSGAHFNPAVTIAFAVVGKFPWKEVPYYLVSQLVSATVACIGLQSLFNEDKSVVMLTLPGPSFNDLSVIAWEVIASFILMWVVSGAASDHRAVKELAGVAIGAAIFVDVLILGKVTGASMNPARSIGPAIAARNFKKLWLYVTAPVVGTISAAAVYNLLQLPNVARGKKKPTTTKPQASAGIAKRFNPTYAGKSLELP